MQRKGGQQPSQRLVNKTESYSHLTLVLDEKLDSLNGGSSRLGDGLFAMRKKNQGSERGSKDRAGDPRTKRRSKTYGGNST